MTAQIHPFVGSSPPRWSAVLRALREARGLTQAGFAAQLGVGTRTVQRWEAGELAPDARAEEALVALCREHHLFRAYADGLLAGVTVTEGWLRDLLAAARLGSSVARPLRGAIERDLTAGPPLPVALTRLVGRERAVEEVGRLLAGTRLVTLTGVGGSGKTRLALATAESLADVFPDGVAFVDLSALTEPGLVTTSIARALGVREQAGGSPVESLADYLGERRLLLVLDNFEQVVEAAPVLPRLLSACGGLVLLVTSRVLLRVSGETEYRVPPLALPDPAVMSDPTALVETPAVALFLARARDVRRDLQLNDEQAAVVAEICVRLDGLPLALELAAARTRVLAPAELRARLDRRLQLLVGGARDAPARQRTLRDTIGWSYDLLSASERAFFRRLAVFAGGWTLEAAEAVCTDEDEPERDALAGFTSLIEQSLLWREEGDGGATRFGMLATVREFALEQLARHGEIEAARDRHAALMLAAVEAAERALQGPAVVATLRRLDAELDNVRAALRWTLDRGDAVTAARLVGCLEWFWYLRGHWHEARQWCAQALAHPALAERPAERARLLWTLGFLAANQADRAVARSWAEEGVVVARATADRLLLGWAYYRLAWVALMSGDLTRADEVSGEAAAIGRAAGNERLLGYALNVCGLVAHRHGDRRRARATLDEALDHAEACGDIWHATMVRSNLADLAYREGDRASARRSYEAVIVAVREFGDLRHLALNLGYLARLLAEEGELERALGLAAESLALSRRMGALGIMVTPLEVAALSALRRDDATRAARLYGSATALRESQALPAASQARDFSATVENELRAAVGDARAQVLLAEGHSLSSDAAVTLALELECSMAYAPR